MTKKRIAVLFGGCSDEYEVSLQSAAAVIAAIDQERYELVLVGITREGRWYRYAGGLAEIGAGRWLEDMSLCTPAILSPDRSHHGLLLPETGELVRLDAVFPLLHGKNGEDGTVQGLLALAGIPIVGCGCLSSALCMDKLRSHQVAREMGVAAPRGLELAAPPTAEEAAAAAERIGYPVFVKPLNSGSSYGISYVEQPGELMEAITRAFRYDSQVLLEEAVRGFEVGCAVIGAGEDLVIGAVDEIELSSKFFDYQDKYVLRTATIHVPARIPAEKAEEIRQTARVLYQALGCTGFARVDMFLNTEGQVIFNEINTIPGFTVHSRYPNMLKAAGMTFAEIVDRIMRSSLGE